MKKYIVSFMALACCECSRSLRVNAEVYCWAMLHSVGYSMDTGSNYNLELSLSEVHQCNGEND